MKRKSGLATNLKFILDKILQADKKGDQYLYMKFKIIMTKYPKK
jgi:hypothetical protein